MFSGSFAIERIRVIRIIQQCIFNIIYSLAGNRRPGSAVSSYIYIYPLAGVFHLTLIIILV